MTKKEAFKYALVTLAGEYNARLRSSEDGVDELREAMIALEEALDEMEE